jgi:hypothetical protein
MPAAMNEVSPLNQTSPSSVFSTTLIDPRGRCVSRR